MKKYRITWDAGYGMSEEIIEADSQQEALEEAERLCQEEAETNWAYDAEPYGDSDDE